MSEFKTKLWNYEKLNVNFNDDMMKASGSTTREMGRDKVDLEITCYRTAARTNIRPGNVCQGEKPNLKDKYISMDLLSIETGQKR